MPDVMHEAARVSYDDALEVIGSDEGDVVGVVTDSVDRAFDGTPTGYRDELPIRVYVLDVDVDGDACGVAGAAMTAYLDLEAARELVDVLEAAILQVEFTRDSRRRRATREPRR